MYETLESGGPLSGSVSISVGSYTEYSRMGPPDVIKSSRCHPDALRGSGVKVPAEKKARVSTKSCGTGLKKQASRAPEQAQERLERHVKRMALEVKPDAGSQAESTGESTSDERVVVRGVSGQPPDISDSQSGGELPLGGPEL